MPNGTIIFTFEGKDYLGLPPEKAQSLNTKLNRLDQLERALPVAQEEIAKLRQTVALAQKSAQLSDAIAQLQTERALKFEALSQKFEAISQKWEAMYNGSEAMRVKCEGFLKRGAVARFLENPIVDLLTKAAPVIIAIVK